jgi:hypothetical protein
VITSDVGSNRRSFRLLGLAGMPDVTVTRAGTAHATADYMREVGAVNRQVLTHTNYDEWAVQMKVMLKMRKLWRAINFGIENEVKDCAAMEMILKAMLLKYVELLGSKDSAKLAWDALKVMHISSDHV